jgi:hypothetical protein
MSSLDKLTSIDLARLRDKVWRDLTPRLKESLPELADAYGVLGLSIGDRSIDEALIRQQYRALARQHHPDRNIGVPNSAQRFQRVQEAYDLLENRHRQVSAVGENAFQEAKRGLESYFGNYAATGGWHDAMYLGRQAASFPIDHLPDDAAQGLVATLENQGYTVEHRYSHLVGGRVITVVSDEENGIRGKDVSRRLKEYLEGQNAARTIGHKEGGQKTPLGQEKPGVGRAAYRPETRQRLPAPSTETRGTRALEHRPTRSPEARLAGYMAPGGLQQISELSDKPHPSAQLTAASTIPPHTPSTILPASGAGLKAEPMKTVAAMGRTEQQALRLPKLGKNIGILIGLGLATASAWGLWAALRHKEPRSISSNNADAKEQALSSLERPGDVRVGVTTSPVPSRHTSWTALVASSLDEPQNRSR